MLPEGGDFTSINWEPFRHRLAEVVRNARTAGEIKRCPIAVEIWRRGYPGLTDGKPGILGAVTSRGAPQVLRLACLFALLDGRNVIGPEHLTAALAVWDYCEASAREIFGEGSGDRDSDKLLTALRGAAEGLTRKQIYHDVFGRHKKKGAIDGLLSDLLTHGLIRRETDNSTGGRPAERWFAGRGVGNAV
jgi:hypothetical protein